MLPLLFSILLLQLFTQTVPSEIKPALECSCTKCPPGQRPLQNFCNEGECCCPVCVPIICKCLHRLCNPDELPETNCLNGCCCPSCTLQCTPCHLPLCEGNLVPEPCEGHCCCPTKCIQDPFAL